MSRSIRMLPMTAARIGAALIVSGVIALASLRAGVFMTRASAWQAQGDIKPTNDAPNPYQRIEGWAKLPEGRTWGSTSAVDVDKDGKSIWVAERCGANSCLDREIGRA